MKIIQWLRRTEVALFDALLGISTMGIDAGERPRGDTYGDANWFQSKGYLTNWLALRAAKLQSSDVVYDIGSGSGRVLAIASLMGVKKCVGVELSADLAALAKVNADSMRLRHSPIQIKQEDASTADYSDGTVFFLCNPFGAKTMAAVLDKIAASSEMNPRRVRIIYIHPHKEHRRLLEQYLEFRPTEERPVFSHRGQRVLYYEAAI